MGAGRGLEGGALAPQSLGGQAVVEGVMVRTPEAWRVAVRRPGGEIAIGGGRSLGLSRTALYRLPLARGFAVVVETLVIGGRALKFSASQLGPIDPGGRGVALAFVLAALLTLFLFVLLPAAGARLVLGGVGGVREALAEGVLRVALFLGYLSSLWLSPEMRRVFAYHGAEHKAIAAWERTRRVGLEDARAESRLHWRCGTSLVFMVLVLALFFFPLLPAGGLWSRLITRLLGLPLLAGVAYEAMRLGAGGSSRLPTLLGLPGIWLQRLTTREPGDEELEVALRALWALVGREGEEPEGLSSPVVWAVVN